MFSNFVSGLKISDNNKYINHYNNSQIFRINNTYIDFNEWKNNIIETINNIDKKNNFRQNEIINNYEQSGIKKNRILIKIAGTWEGIQAVKQLESEGISCNCTLIFSLTQAVACAEAGAFLISPFVGRILDWFKSNTNVTYNESNDPGVESVKKIYHYFKKYNLNTVVMAASFRNTSQIIELAGCDKLTISPALLEELSSTNGEITQKLKSEDSSSLEIERIKINESAFRWHLNENQIASFKLAEGIRLFNKDLSKLRDLILNQI